MWRILPEGISHSRLGANQHTMLFNLKIKILRKFFNWYYRKFPPEMVSWWRRAEKIDAALMSGEYGYKMVMAGEKYAQPNYPRGHILFGRMSKLKHEIKNQVFNDAWALLESGTPEKEVARAISERVLPRIFALAETMRYDFMPWERLSPPVREIWRALTVVEEKSPAGRAEKIRRLKEIVCFIFNEDDAYRFRFQWIAQFLSRRNALKRFEWSLTLLEHAELIGDMKERQRLLLRILSALLKDPGIREAFGLFCKELDWKKVALSKADKYFFRGKYFKVDYPWFEY